MAGCNGFGSSSSSSTHQDAGNGLPVEPVPAFGASWSIALDHQIGSPVSDPTGITFDGVGMWLISGAHNSTTTHLIRYDDVQFTITRDFTLNNLVEAAGTGVYGIAWDGVYVWISVSGNTNKLVAVDPQSGAVVRTWASPTILGPSDLSFDGTSLWIGDGTGKVFEMDPRSGAIKGSFSVTSAFERDHGVATPDGQVLVNGLFGEGLALFTSGGTLISRNATALGPMTFARGQLASVVNGQILFYNVE